MSGPWEWTPPHFGADPHPFQDPHQSALDAATRPVDHTGWVDPNQYRYQADFHAAVEQANWEAADVQRRAEQDLRARPPLSPQEQADANARAERWVAQQAERRARAEQEAKARAHRLEHYCQYPVLHETQTCNRPSQVGGVLMLSALPALLLFVFGGAYIWHLPGYSFSQMWNGGGNLWAAALCASIALLAWWRVVAVERGLNKAARKHMLTCTKPPDRSVR